MGTALFVTLISRSQSGQTGPSLISIKQDYNGICRSDKRLNQRSMSIQIKQKRTVVKNEILRSLFNALR
ncbi:hypothetical protein SDC9_03974 [bioreactor metagenome]|uniref:Uncharacterized protein n=1 Tax=bioreactor metagenome TaxID=1076179 RepID=A0A644SXS5_9ZZZZ